MECKAVEHGARFAVNEWSTKPTIGVLEDIEHVAGAGAGAIGLFERKFRDVPDQAIADALAEHGLEASFCVPRVWTILPVPFNPPGDATDPKERTKQICESIARLAPFRPACIVVGPGVSGDPAKPAGPVEALAEGLAEVADTAAEFGLEIGFELLAERRGSPIHTLPEIVQFIDDVGRDNVGVMWDVWHSWCEPDVHDRLRTFAHRINSVHVNDVQFVERTNFDRVLPGEGRGVAAGLMAALIEGGYAGWWELEVFSDDGTFGMELPDSLWNLPPEEFLARAKAAFDKTYAEAQRLAGAA